MNKDMLRRVLLAVVSILNWLFSVGYIREIYRVMSGENSTGCVDSVYVDGSDVTPLANLAVAGANGLMALLETGLLILLATVFIPIFAILLRVTTIRKKDIVTESEVVFTKRFVMISSVLAFIVGILAAGMQLTGYVIGLSWQQPLFMMLLYYLPLKKRFQKGAEIEK